MNRRVIKNIVAHYKGVYLPASETFIYRYLTHLKAWRPIFVARACQNLQFFPFEQLYGPFRYPKYSISWGLIKVMSVLNITDKYFKRILKLKKVKLIHAHFGNEAVDVIPWKLDLGIPLVTTFYGADMSKLARVPEWRNKYKELFEVGDSFLVEGNHMKQSLVDLGCPASKIRTVHIAIDTCQFPFRKRSLYNGRPVQILFCGRFVEKKGLKYGLKALSYIHQLGYDFRFRIIGFGELESKIKQQVDELGLAKKVEFLGFQPLPRVREEMMKTHLLLQPSVTAPDGDSEGGAPTVLLEAQAMGIPIVSTFHADIPEVVIHRKTGILVPEASPDKLAEALEEMIQNADKWGIIGELGREHVEKNYNIDTEVSKIEKIYGEVTR